jgi:uncharacterized peroxidase-related enzyme
VEAVRKDWRTAPLSQPDKVMLAYVELLTRTPAQATQAEVEKLREAGFDDTAILQIAGIASFFAYVNRMADGLGVGR